MDNEYNNLSEEDFLGSSDDSLNTDPIDPTTGLTTNEDTDSTDSYNDLTVDDFNSLSDYKGERGVGAFAGNRNLNPDEFEGYGNLMGGGDNYKIRAERQPWGEQALHSIYQAGVGEIIGGTIEGAGALVDLVNGDMFRENQEYNNALMELGESIREHTQEVAPIYRANPDAAWDPTDSGWWYSQFPSVVSTVSMMVPAMGVTGAMRMGSKGLRALSKTNKVAKALNMSKKATRMKEAVVGGVASRYVENFREAKGTYDQVFDKANMQFSDDQELHKFLGSKEGQEFAQGLEGLETPEQIKEKAAQWVAADAAALTFKADWANVGFDILQFGSLLKPFKGTRNAGKISRKAREAQDKLLSSPKLPTNKYSRFLDGAKTAGKGLMEAGSEGVEEAINHISAMEGARRGDILLGQKDDRSFGDRMGEYLQQGELWNAVAWGALGGGIFQTIGYAKNMKERNKIEQNKLAEIENRANIFAGLSAKKAKADAAGNRQGFQTTEDLEIYQLGMRAIQAGNMDLLIEQLQDDKMDEVIANEMGIKDPNDIKTKKTEIINKLEELEKSYSSRVNQVFNNKYAELTDEQAHDLASRIAGVEYGLKSTERIIQDLDTQIAEREGQENLEYPTQYSSKRLEHRRESQVAHMNLQKMQQEYSIKKAMLEDYKNDELADPKELEILEEEVKHLEFKIAGHEAKIEANKKLDEQLDLEAKTALSKEEYAEENEWLDREQNESLAQLKVERTGQKALRDTYKETLNAYEKNSKDPKTFGDDPITDALKRTEEQIAESKKRYVDELFNNNIGSLDELDAVKALLSKEEGSLGDYIEKRFRDKNKELVSKGYTRTVREKQMELDLEQGQNEKVIEDSEEIGFDLSDTREFTPEEITDMEAATSAASAEEAYWQDIANEHEDTPKDDLNTEPLSQEPEPNSLEEALKRGQEANAEFEAAVQEQMKKDIEDVKEMSYPFATTYLDNVIDATRDGAQNAVSHIAATRVRAMLDDKKSELAKMVAENEAGITSEESEHRGNLADINENDNGGNTEANPELSKNDVPNPAEGRDSNVKPGRVYTFETNKAEAFEVRRNGNFVSFKDSKGNDLPAMGGRYKIVPKSSLSSEQVQQMESGDQTVVALHHFPNLGYSTANKTPVLSKTITPYTESGEEMAVVWDPGSKPHKSAIDFSVINGGKLSVGDKLTVRKNQYGEISVYHDSTSKPIAKFSISSPASKNFGKLLPTEQNVEVVVSGFSESVLVNLKTEDGSSAKLPFGKHGPNGNASSVVLGYTDSVGAGANIVWKNSDKESFQDPDRTQDAAAGTIYMHKVKPNGKVVPIRMETANISDEAARKLVDMLKNADQNTRQNIGLLIGMSKNTDFGFNPADLKTAYAATKEMIRIPIGGQVIGISYQRNSSGFNNFQQALNGEPFIYRVYDSTGASKAVSSEDTGLTISEEDVVAALKEKKFNVDKDMINKDSDYTSPISGKKYNSYNEMLDGEGILTTDVPASQPFRNTNVKLSFTEGDADVNRMKQDESTKGTTDQTQTTNDVIPVDPGISNVAVGEVEVEQAYYTSDMLKANPDKIYIFGDNTVRRGTGGQAVIRNESNAFGIVTKGLPSNKEGSFLTDDKFAENKEYIDGDIAKIKADGRTVVFPKDGIGTGLAKLKETAPKTFEYLNQRLLEEFGFNNETGQLSTKDTSTEGLEKGLEDAMTKAFESKSFALNRNTPFEKVEVGPLNVYIKKTGTNNISLHVDNKGRNIFGTVTASLEIMSNPEDPNSVYIPNPRGFILWNKFMSSETAAQKKAEPIVDNRFNISISALEALKNNNISSIHFTADMLEEFREEFTVFLEHTKSSMPSGEDRRETVEVNVDSLIRMLKKKQESTGTEGLEDAGEDVPMFKLVGGKVSGEALSEREIKWFTDNFGEDALERYAEQKYILTRHGGQAYGAYSNGIATIAAGAIAGTVYHEAFHLVTDLGLSNKEKDQLFRAAEKKYGKKSSKELEEDMALDFEKYMLTRNKKGIVPAILRLFDSIIAHIEKFLGRENEIKSYYSKIRKGTYKGSNARAELKKFTLESYKEKPGYSIDEKQEVADMLDFIFIDEVEKGMANGDIKMTIEDLLGISVDPKSKKERAAIIEQYMEKTRERLQTVAGKMAGSPVGRNLIDILSKDKWEAKVDPNTGDVIEEGWRDIFAARLKAHGIDVRYKAGAVVSDASNTAEDDLQEGTRDMEKHIHGQEAALRDTKIGMSKMLKIKMSMIPKVDAKGKPVKGKKFGQRTFEDFNVIYSDAQTKLVGTPEYLIEQKLEELAVNDANMNALHAEYQTWRDDVKAAFKSQMTAQQKKYFTTIIEKDGSIKVIETNRQGIERQLVEEWKERRHVAPIFSGEKINMEVAAEVEGKFGKLAGLARENNVEGYMDVAQDILEQFGIELSTSDRNYLLRKTRDPQTGELTKGDIGRIANLMRGQGSSFVKMFNGPNKAAEKGVKHGVNPYATENTAFFLNLAKELKNVRTDIFGGAFINGEGQQVFSINYNTFLSKKLAKVHNDAEFQKMIGMFYKDVFYAPGNGQKDFLLNMLENKDLRKMFDIRSLDTLKDKDQSADGIGYDSLTPGNSYLLRLAAYQNGKNEKFGLFNTGTKSDKGESIYARLPRINPKAGKEVWLIPDQILNKETIRKNAIEILKKTAYQEIARIKQVQQELNNPNFTEDLYVENMHKPSKKSGGKINGLHFMHIPTLNDYLIGEDGLLLDDDHITEALLAEGINAYIQSDIDATVEDMINKGLLSVKNGVLTGENLPTDITLNLNDVSSIIEEFITTDLIWRNEMQKFQYGDLAAYKSEMKNTSTGFFLDVTTDASKRGYQMVTPGMDHVTKSTEGGYGKSKTYTMAIMKDIEKENTTGYTLNIARAFDSSVTKTQLENYLKNHKKEGYKFSGTPKQLKALKVASAYSTGINKTDAQGYITLDAYKETLEGRGEWSSLHAEAYKYWKKGELGLPEHQNLLLQPLKTFSYGPRELTRMDPAGRPYTKVIYEQVKHSTVPLLPGMTKLFPELNRLRERMEGVGEFSKYKNDKIDVLNFDSAVKVGGYGIGSYDNLDGLMSRVMLSENERTPLTIPTKKGADPKDGSQFAKLILANIKPTDTYSLGNTDISGKELITLYNDLYYEKIKKSADALADKIGWNDYQKDRSNPAYQKKFLMSVKEEIVSQLRERDMPESYEEALTLIQEAEKVDFKLPMNFPLFSRKFEIVIASMFKSKVLTQTFPGTSLVQVAEFGRSDELKWMNPKIVYDKDGNVDVKASSTTPAEAAIPYKLAEKYGITKYVKEDGRIDLDAYNEDVKNTNIDKNLLNFIAYRIPTQGKNSMAMFKIVKVLPPNSGSSIVLPGEITTQMGADFDVDKLFIQFPTAGKVQEKDGRDYVSKSSLNYAKVVGEKDALNKDFSAEILAKDEAKLNNMLFDLRWSVLSSPLHADEVLNPLDSETYGTLLDEFSELGIGSTEFNRYFGGTHTDVYLEDVNRDAKVLVGIFSTHSVAHAAAQLVNLQLDAKKAVNIGIEGTNIKSSTNLSGREGHDGELISTYISENQNASLDNAKDPITGKLNINKFTSNVISLLNRTGYNNRISTHFVNQPAIRELYRQHQLNPKEDISVLADNVAKSFGIQKDFNTAKALHKNGARLDGVEVTDKSLEKGLSEDNPLLQAQVLSDFLNYHATGITLSRSNKVLSPDRISDMSSLSAIEYYDRNYMDVISGEGGIIMNDPLEGNSYKRMGAFYKHAIKGAETMLSEFFPYNEVSFKELKDHLGTALGANRGILSKDQADIVNNAAMAWAMTKHPMLRDAMTTENYNRLVFNEQDYLAKRLVAIKDKYNLSDNGLLKFLKEDVRFVKEEDGGQLRYAKKISGFKGISFNNTSKMTSTQKTLIQDRWAELLSTPHAEAIVKKANPGMSEKELETATAEVVKLAEDLVTYSIISTGFQSGPRSFIDMVPLKYWTNSQMNMRKFLLNENMRMKEDTNYFTDAVQQIVQNNTKLVSAVESKDMAVVKDSPLKRVKADAAGAVAQGEGFKEFIKTYADGKLELYQRVNEVMDDNGAPVSADYQQIEILGEPHRMVEYNAQDNNLQSSHPDNILDGRDTGVETMLSKRQQEETAAHNRQTNPNIVTADEQKTLTQLYMDMRGEYNIPQNYFIQKWSEYKKTNPDIQGFVSKAQEIFKNCKK